jgi:multiple sugar transport system ATP-binding protein
VFLFDEPLSNLDAKLRVQMRAEIARLHQRLKTTVIYVTHDQVEAMTLGQRIVLLNQGIVQQVDTPMKIYQRPANRFVGSFIGSPAMNFFDGEVSSGGFQLRGGGRIPLDGSLPDGAATLGVRPEDLLTDGDGLSLAQVTLDVVEHMGHETMVHFALSGAEHVARLGADAQVEPGDQLALAVRPGAYHLFANDDAGRRLN